MAVTTIKITVISKDGLSLIGCPTTVHLPCPQSTIDGSDWYIRSDNLQQTWKFPPYLTPATLPAVSFPTAKVTTLDGHTYYAIADQDESPAQAVNQILSDLCNFCCTSASPAGGEPDATAGNVANIIPPLYAMANGDDAQNCSTGTCTYSYYDILPTDSTNNYSITFVCGGVARSSGNTKFTTKAAALAWANSNLSAYATFTLSGQQLKASLATCAQGSLFHTNY